MLFSLEEEAKASEEPAGEDNPDEKTNEITLGVLRTDEKGNAVPGAQLKLTAVTEGDTTPPEADPQENQDYTWTSGAEAEQIGEHLKAGGTYTISEETAPEGYLQADPVTIKVNEDNSIAIVGEDGAEEKLDQATIELTGAKIITMPKLGVLRTDMEKNPVAGAIIELRASSTLTAEATMAVQYDGESEPKTWAAGDVIHEANKVLATFSSAATSKEISKYLVPGGSYIIGETGTPEGYTLATAVTLKVDGEGVITLSDGTQAGETVYLESEKTEAAKLKLPIAVKAGTKTGEKPDKDVFLKGAKLAILDADGNVLTDAKNKPWIVTTPDKKASLSIDTARFPALTKGLKNGETRTFSVSEIEAPSGYTFCPDLSDSTLDFVIQKDPVGKLSVKLAEDSEGDGVMTFWNIPESGDFVIKVSKTMYVTSVEAGNRLYAKTVVPHYVALFSDAKRTQRISDVKSFEIGKGNKIRSVYFRKLLAGTYYVGETDAYGNLISSTEKEREEGADYYPAYNGITAVKGYKVELKLTETQAAVVVQLQNIYDKLDENRFGLVNTTALFNVRVIVLDENGNPLKTTEKFPLGLFSNGATTTKTIFSFGMGGNAEKQIDGYGLVLKGDDQSRKIQIHVVNKDGKATATTGDYKVMSINPAEATIKRGDAKPPTIVITLQKQKKETESTKPTESSSNTEKDDFGDGKATLTFTKNVLYKGQPIKINKTFYLGIFFKKDDQKAAKVVPLRLVDASTYSGHTSVNLAKIKKITLYFDEVKSDGTRVGKDFGYSYTLNKTETTLKAGNMKDEIVLTNSFIVGGSEEKKLTDPTSGLAGDRAALAEAQQLAASGNSSANTPTGDSTPIIPIVIALAAAAAAIAGVLIYRTRRRK